MRSDSDTSADATTDDLPTVEAVNQALVDGVDEPIEIDGENEVVQPIHPESLSVVSESNYRCIDEDVSTSITERYVIRYIFVRMVFRSYSTTTQSPCGFTEVGTRAKVHPHFH